MPLFRVVAGVVVVYYKLSGSNISKTVGPKFTKFCPNIQPDPVYTTPDMTSCQHLSKYENTAENDASDGFVLNFSGAAFAYPTRW